MLAQNQAAFSATWLLNFRRISAQCLHVCISISSAMLPKHFATFTARGVLIYVVDKFEGKLKNHHISGMGGIAHIAAKGRHLLCQRRHTAHCKISSPSLMGPLADEVDGEAIFPGIELHPEQGSGEAR